jgi:murein DD-endopeptidase MepM/ murein hydrolase activator NlpD
MSGAAAAALAALAVLVLAGASHGQIAEPEPTTTAPAPLPTDETTTTTTTTTTTAPQPGETTTTTAPPPAGTPLAPEPSSPPPPPGSGSTPEGDGGGQPPAEGRSVPPEAQRIIDAVVRTPANSTAGLMAGVGQLVDLGLPREEAIRLAFGRFPIAGAARYSHDWLFPRYGPGFRFHLGTDVFADFGTPLRAPVDGTATSNTSSLGGLSLKVHMDDGTYFYMAHLSALVDGFTQGMRVSTGDIVGYVGDSGNARGGAPHLHLGIYPKGGEATDPKPILDRFIAEAEAQLPALIERVRAERPAGVDAGVAAPAAPDTSASTLARSWSRPWTERSRTAVPTEVLYQATGNPSAGGMSVARSEAERLAASIDWSAWSNRTTARRELLRRTEEAFRAALGPVAGRSGSQFAAR